MTNGHPPQAGLLVSEQVPWGPKSTKKEYRVTEEGLVAFRAWMDAPLPVRRQRDPAYLKAAYLEWADPEAAREQLRGQRAHWEEHLALLEATRAALLDRSHPTLAARLNRLEERAAEVATRYKVHAYDGLIAHARTELDWIEQGLALVDELGERPGGEG